MGVSICIPWRQMKKKVWKLPVNKPMQIKKLLLDLMSYLSRQDQPAPEVQLW